MSFLVALSKAWNFLLWTLLVTLEFFTKFLSGLVRGNKTSQEGSAKRGRHESPPPPPRHRGEEHWDARHGWDRYEDHHRSPYQSPDPPSLGYSPGGRPYPARDNYTPTEYRYRGRNIQPDDYSPPGYPQGSPGYALGNSSTQSGSSRASVKRPRLERKYSKIIDQYCSLEEVTEALAEAGLESSNLIVGVDFTKSNEWTGKISFNGQSLHHIGNTPNPYEQAISIIGQSLATFDEDNLIPCFGFGDASTHDQEVFGFYPDKRPCNGFQEALSRYRELVPHLRLSGPTSFAPIIEMAMTIVEQSGGQYHVLLIIADGQVTRSVDTEYSQLSTQEQNTVDAIVKASHFPLSIILVGVGDGPWDMMKEFDDNVPARSFDNFQFVNFTSIMSKKVSQTKKEMEFALAALMEIPLQYKATLELGILGCRNDKSPNRVPLNPPRFTSEKKSSSSIITPRTSQQQNVSSHRSEATTVTTPLMRTTVPIPPEITSASDPEVCPICCSKPRDMAFGCGHQTCAECGPKVQQCPICRRSIDTRIKLS